MSLFSSIGLSSDMISVIVSVILGLLLCKVWKWCTNYSRFVRIANDLPGTSLQNHPHPWLADIGVILNLPKFGVVNGTSKTEHSTISAGEPDFHSYLCEMGTKYEKEGLYRRWQYNPYRLPFLSKSRTVIFDPELIEEVLSNSSKASKAFPRKSTSFQHAEPLFHDSFISMPDGIEWKRNRKLASLGFSHVVLEKVTQSVFKLLHEDVFPTWNGNIDSSMNNGGVPTVPTDRETIHHSKDINMKIWMHTLALDVLGLAAFSFPLGTSKKLAQEDRINAEKRGHFKYNNNREDYLVKEGSMHTTNSGRQDGSSGSAYRGCSGDEHGSHEQLLFHSTNQLVYAIRIMSKEMQTRVRVPLRAFLMKILWFTKTVKTYDYACQIFDNTIALIVSSRIAGVTSTAATTEKENIEQTQPLQHADLLSSLVGKSLDGYKLPHKNIFGNARMFIFAGSDTTANSLAFAVWYITKHPHVQEKMRKELDPLFEQAESPLRKSTGMACKLSHDNRTPTTAAASSAHDLLKRLPYLNAVIKETLRLSPAASVEREAVRDVVIRSKSRDQEYLIPKGMTCMIMQLLTHRHSEYWEKPTEFIPERFLTSDYSIPVSDDDNNDTNKTETKKKKYHPNQFIPFSTGPRSCVGQYFAMAELRAALAQIVYNYDLVPSPYQTEEAGHVFALTVAPHEAKVRVKRRKQ